MDLTYPTAAVDKSRGVNWRFVYTPEAPDATSEVRPVTEQRDPPRLPRLRALPAGGPTATRASGGRGWLLQRRAHLPLAEELPGSPARRRPSSRAPSASPPFTTYARPPGGSAPRAPYIVGMRTVALEPSTGASPHDSDKRLIAGVIERYGEPEERMGAQLPPPLRARVSARGSGPALHGRRGAPPRSSTA